MSIRRAVRSPLKAVVRSPLARVTSVIASGYSGSITPSFTKTLVGTGTIPQAVLFEATSTTSNTDAHSTALGGEFRQLTHSWNFGDSGSGTWAVTGDAKNAANGPVAAHVFETAGTFTVTYTATLGTPWQTSTGVTPMSYTVGTIVYTAGNTYRCFADHVPGVFATDLGTGKWTLVHTGLDQVSTTSTVTVADISAANTICVNGTGTSDGLGPVGCTYAIAVPNAAGCDGKKILLRRGTTGYAIPTLTGSQGAIFGAYGAGAKPGAGTGIATSTNGTGYTAISDLSVAGVGSGTQTGNIGAGGANVLIMRCTTLTQADGCIGLGSVIANDYAANFNLFLVENTLTGNSLTECNYAIIGSGRKVAIMGNVSDVIRFHDFRSGGLDTAVVCQNWFKGNLNTDGFEPVKLHSQGVDTYPAGTPGTRTTNKVVFSRNTLGTSTAAGGWMSAFSPQQDGDQQGVENILVEDNLYTLCVSPGGQYDILFGARNFTYRRNTRTGGGNLEIAAGFHTPAIGFNGPSWGG